MSGIWSYTYKDGVVKWFVTLKVGKKWVYRQHFYSKEEAIAARKQAELEFLVDLEHKHDILPTEKPDRQRDNLTKFEPSSHKVQTSLFSNTNTA